MSRGFRHWRDTIIIVTISLLATPIVLLALVAHIAWTAIDIGWACGWKITEWMRTRTAELVEVNHKHTGMFAPKGD